MYVIINSARRIKFAVFCLSALLAIGGIVYARVKLPYLPWAIDIALVAVFLRLWDGNQTLFINRIDSKLMWLFCCGKYRI